MNRFLKKAGFYTALLVYSVRGLAQSSMEDMPLKSKAQTAVIPKTQDSLKASPQVIAPPKVTKIKRAVPDPYVYKYPESAKNEEMKIYEAEVSERLRVAALQIEDLISKYRALDSTDQSAIISSLRTAEGNRSVVKTKLKQLSYHPPAQWKILKVGLDKAILNLEASVIVLEDKIPES
ncbi:MAG: hypothetical protein EOP04_07430 [Proteobacteria bacterium]|nr:MAG: hypothetical protein EOP04_07430 [Pseudomonadota bacterium]